MTDNKLLLEEIQRQLVETAKNIAAFLKSGTFKQIQVQAALTGFIEWMRGVSVQLSAADVQLSLADLLFWAEFAEGAKDLMPYVREEVQAYQEANGGNELSFAEFMRNVDPDTGEHIESIFDKMLKRAQERAAENAAAAEAAAKLQAAGVAWQYTGKQINKYIIPNNNLANSLTGRPDNNTGELLPIVNAGAFDLPVGNGNITAYTMVTLDSENSEIKFVGRPYTWYDRSVSNTVISLWKAGNDIVYPEQICRTRLNKTGSEKVSQQQVAAVTRSIEKQRQIHVFIDLTDEMQKRANDSRKRGIEVAPGTAFIIDDFLLSLTGITIKVGGAEKKAYRIQREPILYTYSKLNGQIITVSPKLLDIKKVDKKTGAISSVSLSATERRDKIREYLLWRIEVMKHDRKNKKTKQSPHICYDTLYRETDTPIEKEKKQLRQKTRTDALLICDFWKAKGYIKGYHEYPEKDRNKQGIEIEFERRSGAGK